MLLLLLPASVHVRVKSINMKGKQTGSQASAHFWTLHKQPGTQNKKKVRNKANPSKKKRNSSCSLLAKKPIQGKRTHFELEILRREFDSLPQRNVNPKPNYKIILIEAYRQGKM